MPRYAILLLALGCLAATTVAADTPAEPATFVRTPKYRSIADALAAAAANPNSDISILAAAVSASGLAIPRDVAWTLLAPTNDAFAATLARLNLTAQAVLANRPLLTAVLSYHIIPEGAIMLKRFQDRAQYVTFTGNRTATPQDLLTADVSGKLKRRRVTLVGGLNNATIVQADIKAGRSIIHKINSVLLPPALLPQGRK